MTTKEATWTIGRAYVRRIRNWSKRQYATAYLNYLLCGGYEPIPPIGLSVMGAQAVRLQLHELYRLANFTS